MKQNYLCKKDWLINHVVYFQKGKTYKGKILKNGLSNQQSVQMKGESGISITFHTGSEYFDIPEKEVSL